jgi:Ni,Fe-hydrogenase maturation factor
MRFREIIKRLLGIEADIQRAVKKEREIAESEKRQITNEHEVKLQKALAEKEKTISMLEKKYSEIERKYKEEQESFSRKMEAAAKENEKKSLRFKLVSKNTKK